LRFTPGGQLKSLGQEATRSRGPAFVFLFATHGSRLDTMLDADQKTVKKKKKKEK